MNRKFSRRVYRVPFGRYEGTNPGEFPLDEVLVGRARERARMMDWLLNTGRRGAYLITGYRGVGKSSFIQFCLEEYEDDVYGRYMQSRVGRALIWDRVLTALVIPVLLMLPLIASRLLSGLIAVWPSWGRWQLVVSCVVALPLLIVTASPLLYATQLAVLRANAHLERPKNAHTTWSERVRLDGFPAAGILVVVAVPPLVAIGASAIPAGAFCLAALSLTFLAVHAASVEGRMEARGTLVRDPYATILETIKSPENVTARFCAAILWMSGFALLLLGSLALGWSAPVLFDLALWAAAVAHAFRAHDGSRLARHIPGHPIAILAEREARGDGFVSAALLVLAVVVAVLAGSWEPFAIALGLTTVGLSMRFAYLGPRSDQALRPVPASSPLDTWFFLHPRPRFLLTCKAFLAAVFGWLVWVEPVVRGKCRLGIEWRWPFAAGGFRRPFQDWQELLIFLGLSLLLGLLLVHLEHDWIARRQASARRDDAYDRTRGGSSPADDGVSGGGAHASERARERRDYLRVTRVLARATTFWSLFGTWLPAITVRINLGFDTLSHSQVVTAMLLGLRDQYHRAFISRRSLLGLITRFVRLAALATAALVLGDWLKRIDAPWARSAFGAGLAWFPYVPFGAKEPVWITMTGYNFAVFVVLLAAARVVLASLGVVSFRRMHARIERVVDSLTSTVRVTKTSEKLVIPRGPAQLDMGGTTHQVDTPPLDPRTVERIFLELLRDLQTSRFALPGGDHLLSLPAPQVTFVFDELDKIGVQSHESPDRPGIVTHGTERQRSRQIHRLFADMKNLLSSAPARFIFVGGRELHDEWLADLTSRQPLLSNIFDGEIYLPTLLADPVDDDRAPDDAGPLGGRGAHLGQAGIHAYLNAQIERTGLLEKQWQTRRVWGNGAFEWVFREPHLFFVQGPDVSSPRGSAWTVHEADSGEITGDRYKEFMRDLVLYLSFRSRGNPKRLKALVEGFLWPVGHVIRQPELRWSKFKGQHVLRFGHVELFSIELVANVYRRMDLIVRSRVQNGDDKIIRSALYLADYLLKFHRRAFSWTSLERIDELLHVHRAPDLRQVLNELLQHWSKCFIQPIVEGMHDFRFRSEVAAEVRYISRRSEAEMAAFNFTLDEAQALKSEYLARLEKLDNEGKVALAEVKAALGELHDFDEEFEEARRYYRSALTDLDDEVVRAVGSGKDVGVLIQMLGETAVAGEGGDDSPERAGAPPSRTKSDKPLRRQVEWSVRRLRLMLQIGMTYERSRNYETAFVHYRDARSVARAMWLAMIDDFGRGSEPTPGFSEEEERRQVRGAHRLEILKNLPLVYQAIFACAWVGEKAPSLIDGSLSMVEQALWDIRCRLPFVRLKKFDPASSHIHLSHANFALTLAGLHLNAGNLCFFKGCQSEEARADEADGAGDEEFPRVTGYLMQAQYHYACAIRDLQDLAQYRMKSAWIKLDPYTDEPWTPFEPWPTLPRGVLPEFVLRRASAALLGLAGVWLARVSLHGLLVGAAGHACASELVMEKTRLEEWFNGKDSDESEEEEALFGKPLRPDRPRPPPPSNPPRSIFDERNGGSARLISFPRTEHRDWLKVKRFRNLSRWGAKLLERGGHREEAAREFLWLAGSLEVLAWSLHGLGASVAIQAPAREVKSQSGKEPPADAVQAETDELTKAPPVPGLTLQMKEAITKVVDLGRDAVVEAVRLLAVARGAGNEPVTPSHAKRITFSLAMLDARLRGLATPTGSRSKDVEPARAEDEAILEASVTKCDTIEKLADWIQHEAGGIEDRKEGHVRHRRRLERLANDSAYSMLNHLMTLRVLLLDEAAAPAPRSLVSPEPLPAWNEKEAKRLYELLSELWRLDGEYASPMHFTPFHCGSAIVLGAEKMLDVLDVKESEPEKGDSGKDEQSREPGRRRKKEMKNDAHALLAHGIQALRRSGQMYSSRAAYYEAISDMYFLDDDFNDRCIHLHHAVQMMGADLSRELIRTRSHKAVVDPTLLRSWPAPPMVGNDQAKQRETPGSPAEATPVVDGPPG